MSALAFELPAALEATAPPEARGVRRDGVRLMVAQALRRLGSSHASFGELPRAAIRGDLLVVNVSATLPGAVAARRRGRRGVRVHVATRAPRLDQSWRVVELRGADGASAGRARPSARRSRSTAAPELELVAPYASGARLMLARISAPTRVDGLSRVHGRPIRYGYVKSPWPLEAYQTVYATTPGSAEMPSAGRPFTRELITRLVAGGVLFAPITLHTGVSSPERHEAPLPEHYEVPEPTARWSAPCATGAGA